MKILNKNINNFNMNKKKKNLIIKILELINQI